MFPFLLRRGITMADRSFLFLVVRRSNTVSTLWLRTCAPTVQTLHLSAQPYGLSRPAQQAPPPIFPGSAVEALRRPP
jgi:hypothetical protein